MTRRTKSLRVEGGIAGAFLVAVTILLGGCSIRSIAVGSLADTLAASGSVFASDDDPELVAEAVPFALKTMEILLAERPDHRDLRAAAARGFTQYSYAFVELEAERLELEDWSRSRELRERAVGLYLRARDHGLAGLAVGHEGIAEALRLDPESAVRHLGEEDLELTYWTGLAWGAALSAGRDRPELLGDLGAVRALLERVESIDEGYDDGGVHEALMALEASALLGGSREEAERHFRRAVELSDGLRASPFVTYAEVVAVPNQERELYVEMLERALAVDPDAVPRWRLANLKGREKAAWMLERVDEYFLSAEESMEETS